MAKPLALTLFGSPEVQVHDQPVTGFRSSKACALLYYLAVTARPHMRPMLAGLFWGDQPEAAARTSLSKCLSNLRDLVGDAVLVDRQTVAFNRQRPYHLDTEGFLVGLAQPPTPETLPTWQAALAIYRGDFLEGFYVRDAPDFEQWVLVQRAHYREAVVQGLHTLANYTEQQGNLSQAISHTRRLLTLEPWREEAHRQLMTRLARSGQRAAALAQFETCRRVLEEELAVEPDTETVALVEVIRADKVTRWQDEKMLEVSSHPVINNLPIPPTPLIGRERELAELSELIGNPHCRLITITGPGGMGKTRLALAAATEESGKFQHGAVFVPLAGISSAQFLSQAILTALNVPLRGDLSPQQQIGAHLSKQECLLLLDNYEHLLPDVELLLDLLHYAPNIVLLVTSRERLALQAEHLFEMTGLNYPQKHATKTGTKLALNPTDYAAIQLFLQRVRQTQPRFTPNDEEIRAIVRIGRVTAGMPLALELAAAMVREQSCSTLATALETGQLRLSSRLRDLPERHRTMATVFDHSWDLLSTGEQQVLAALSVFRGGFEVEAAQEVACATLAILAGLLDKSWLYCHPGGRYDIHELVCQYASQQLTETEAYETILSNHCAYFLQFASNAEPKLYGAQQKGWLERLEGEHDNFRAALSHCLLKDPAMALQLAVALYRFWYLRGNFSEGRSWLAQALAHTLGEQTVIRGKALIGAGRLAWVQGELEQATNFATEGLDLFHWLADLPNTVRILNLLGAIELYKCKLDQAQLLFEQALVLNRQVSNLSGIAGNLLDLGLVATYQKNYSQAKTLLEESLRMRYLQQEHANIGICLANLGINELYWGNLNNAATYYREAISISLGQRDIEHVSVCLEGLAAILVAKGDNQNCLQRAACLFGAAQTFRNNFGIPIPKLDQPYYESSISQLRSQLNEAAVSAAWAEGAAMSLEQAVAYALADPTNA